MREKRLRVTRLWKSEVACTVRRQRRHGRTTQGSLVSRHPVVPPRPTPSSSGPRATRLLPIDEGLCSIGPGSNSSSLAFEADFDEAVDEADDLAEDAGRDREGGRRKLVSRGFLDRRRGWTRGDAGDSETAERAGEAVWWEACECRGKIAEIGIRDGRREASSDGSGRTSE